MARRDWEQGGILLGQPYVSEHRYEAFIIEWIKKEFHSASIQREMHLHGRRPDIVVMNDSAMELIVEVKAEKWGYALEQAKYWKNLRISRRVCIGMPTWVWGKMLPRNRNMIRESGIGFLGADESGNITHYAIPKDQNGKQIHWPSSVSFY